MKKGSGISAESGSDKAGPSVPGAVPLNIAGLKSRISITELNDTVRILIKLLDRRSPGQKALIPLLQLMRELPVDGDGSLLDSRDSRLLQKVLIQWRNRFGNQLDSRVRSELELLERQFAALRDESVYSLVDETSPQVRTFRLYEEERKNKDLGQKEEALLVLDMVLPESGRIRSSLSSGEEGAVCRIACDSGSAQGRLRKALPALRKRLSRFQIKELSLSRLRKKREKNGHSGGNIRSSDDRAVQLWG